MPSSSNFRASTILLLLCFIILEFTSFTDAKPTKAAKKASGIKLKDEVSPETGVLSDDEGRFLSTSKRSILQFILKGSDEAKRSFCMGYIFAIEYLPLDGEGSYEGGYGYLGNGFQGNGYQGTGYQGYGNGGFGGGNAPGFGGGNAPGFGGGNAPGFGGGNAPGFNRPLLNRPGIFRPFGNGNGFNQNNRRPGRVGFGVRDIIIKFLRSDIARPRSDTETNNGLMMDSPQSDPILTKYYNNMAEEMGKSMTPNSHVSVPMTDYCYEFLGDYWH